MHIVALFIESNTAVAATQSNKRRLLYFSRMAQQRGFRQRNCCRALANREKNEFRVTRPMFGCQEMTWLKFQQQQLFSNLQESI